jgi:HSP20 family protein
MDRAFNELERELGEYRGATGPRITLGDAGEQLLLRAELPGLSENDVEITVNANTLTLRGERKDDAPEGYAVQRKERRPFKFARSFQLPCKIDPDRTKASMRDGILTLTLPKAADARPKQITVNAS